MRITGIPNDQYVSVLLDHGDLIALIMGTELTNRKIKWLRDNGCQSIIRVSGHRYITQYCDVLLDSHVEWSRPALERLSSMKLLDVYTRLKMIQSWESVVCKDERGTY